MHFPEYGFWSEMCCALGTDMDCFSQLKSPQVPKQPSPLSPWVFHGEGAFSNFSWTAIQCRPCLHITIQKLLCMGDFRVELGITCLQRSVSGKDGQKR